MLSRQQVKSLFLHDAQGSAVVISPGVVVAAVVVSGKEVVEDNVWSVVEEEVRVVVVRVVVGVGVVELVVVILGVVSLVVVIVRETQRPGQKENNIIESH